MRWSRRKNQNFFQNAINNSQYYKLRISSRYAKFQTIRYAKFPINLQQKWQSSICDNSWCGCGVCGGTSWSLRRCFGRLVFFKFFEKKIAVSRQQQQTESIQIKTVSIELSIQQTSISIQQQSVSIEVSILQKTVSRDNEDGDSGQGECPSPRRQT